MADWRDCRLGDLGIVSGGGTPSRERAEYWDGPIPWITPGELTGNRKKFVSETKDSLSELGLAVSGANLLPERSLLVTSRASIGSCALTGKPMATNQGFKSLIPHADVDPSFLFHLGQTLGREMTRRASGTTFLEISAREFEHILIRLPPLDEQQKIAEILDTIDATVQATERVVAKLEMQRRALSESVFGGQDWHSSLDVVAVGNLLARPPRNGASPHESERWRGGFMLGLGCLTETGFAPQQLKWAPDIDGSLQRAVLADGDLLVSRSNTEDRVGFVGRYRSVGHPCIYPDLMMRLVPNAQISARYLELALQSGPARRQIRRLASGTSGSMVKITGEAVSKLLVAIYSSADQVRCRDAFDALSIRRNAEEYRLSKLRDLRAGVAADLLSARIRTVKT